ncbi:MAG: glycoside hydrolase family 3 protein [Bacteroidales bacterium]|nr:glycoside hydrolase family 3 protein [Bacteroidales bacterium]
MKRIYIVLLAALAFSCTCSVQKPATTSPQDPIGDQLRRMTLREKVGQLFCVRPEAFDVALEWDSYEELASHALQDVTPQMKRVNEDYPVGGVILFAHNIADPEQLDSLVKKLKAFKGEPLLYIDEEGGRVARIGNNPAFKVKKYKSMGAIGKTLDTLQAYDCGKTIGAYLKEYGFDVDLAPVADVNTNPHNPIIGTRAFSPDPKVAAEMVVSYLNGLQDAGLAGCVKHFPGHGDTRTDTHFGYAQSKKTWEEMLDCELLPFKSAIENHVPLVMISHIAAPAVTGNSVPASLSPVLIQEKLRGEMGYDGVIITDGMAMGAITRQYKPGRAAVLSLQAGADIILGPKDFIEAFDAVMDAVQVDSTLTEARIDESVRRVLTLKAQVRQ